MQNHCRFARKVCLDIFNHESNRARNPAAAALSPA
jgi:hypothetical protein